MKPAHRIIAADLGTDLGNRLVSLTLLDQLVFKGATPLWHLAGLTLAEQLPAMVLSPFAGAAVDRIGAGRWLALTLAGKSLLAVGLLLCIRPTAVLPVYFVFIASSLGFNLGRLAIIPGLVPPDRLIPFNALNERIAILGGITAYALMGHITAAVGPNGALSIAIFFFAAAFGSVFRLSPAENARPAANTPGNQTVKNSAGRLWPASPNHSPALGSYFALMGVVVLAGGILNFTLPLIFRLRFEGDIASWGVVMALYQIGAFLSTLLLPFCWTHLGWQRLLVATFAVLAGAMVAAGWIGSIVMMGALMLVLGCGFTLAQIALESLIQQHSPRLQRGRIAAWVMMQRGFCYCGTSLAGACLSSRFAPEPFILFGALLPLAAALPLVRFKSRTVHMP